MTRLASRRHSQNTNSATQVNGVGPSGQHNNVDAQDASQVNSSDSGQPQSGDAATAGPSTMAPIAAPSSGSVPLTQALSNSLVLLFVFQLYIHHYPHTGAPTSFG